MSIKIVVFITPDESFSNKLSSLFLTLKQETLVEEGCFQFDIYKHGKDFVLIEDWADQDAIDLHMQKPYTKLFIAKTKGKMINTSVNRLEIIG